MDSYRIKRKSAVSIGAAIREYLGESRLRPGLNTRRIFAAWDAASGAGPLTLKRYFRSGKLYITLSSAVVRSQLYPRRKALTDKMNEILSRDEFFSPEDGNVSWIEELILK
jgi:hypothetical protein